MDNLYWRLHYYDNSVMDEADDNQSIMMSRPGAAVLMVCQPLPEGRVPLCRIDLFDEDGAVYKPIFYRKRSLGLEPNAKTRLDLTVFGRARAVPQTDDLRLDVKLYASADGKTVFDCPEWALDKTAIENLLFARY